MAKSTRAPLRTVSTQQGENSPHPFTIVAHRLQALDDDSRRQVDRLRAFAASILALVPVDPGAHPALKTQPTMPPAADAQRWELREALMAVRTLAEAIEDAAWRLQADVQMGLTDVCAELEIERGAA